MKFSNSPLVLNNLENSGSETRKDMLFSQSGLAANSALSGVGAGAAVLATLAYFLWVPKPWTKQDIATVAIAGCNIFALLALFWRFYKLESATNAQFGKVVHENLGTIVPAMILGSRLIQSQKAAAVASATPDRKLAASLS